MYIINNDDTKIVEAKEICIKLDYKYYKDDSTVMGIYYSAINYFNESMENDITFKSEKEYADYNVWEYLKDKSPNICIMVNGEEFGSYEYAKGMNIFNAIIDAMKNGQNLFDLSIIKYPVICTTKKSSSPPYCHMVNKVSTDIKY